MMFFPLESEKNSLSAASIAETISQIDQIVGTASYSVLPEGHGCTT